MNKISLHETLEFSRIVCGLWRMSEWNKTTRESNRFIQQLVELGITTFDHADIYGDYSCENLFGEALELSPELRRQIQIVTKCGIMLKSEKFPENKLKHYNTSKKHIITSVENSLKNLKTDHIDLLLIHRPDPFMEPAETAEAFSALKAAGKVAHFGVSNFLPQQFDMLSSYLPFPLVTNQIEISPLCLQHFEAGTIDQCLEKRIHPMAWSPLAGGRIFTSENERAAELRIVLQEMTTESAAKSIDQTALAWLLAHPAGIIPVIGSGNLSRIKSAAAAVYVKLNRQQWFKILEAATASEVA